MQVVYRLSGLISPESQTTLLSFIYMVADTVGVRLLPTVHLWQASPRPACAVCLSPWTDLTGSGDSVLLNADKDLIIEPTALKPAAELYLGGADPHTPLASPLFANLSGLPPLLIQVGSDEILLSDATSFAERAQGAGVDVNLEVWENMQHVWQFAARFIPEARQAIDRIGKFIIEITNNNNDMEESLD